MKNRKGFTLTELLVAIAMIAVIGTVIIVNTVSINKRAKDTEYDRMVENVINSAKTYVSLYPEEFGDLYSTKAFSYISLKELVHSGLLDEEIINPYTNKQLDLEDQYLGHIKAYVDGNSFEIVYKYPLTEDDYDTERYLVTTTINTYEDEKGFKPFYLYEGVEGKKASIDFGISDENGNLIEDLPGYTYLIDGYKAEFKLSAIIGDNFTKCSSELENCTESTLWKEDDTSISKDDIYFPNSTGTFEIKYNWEYTDKNGKVHKKETIRNVRVTSASEREKEKITANPVQNTEETTSADPNGIIYQFDGKEFNGDSSIETIPLLDADNEGNRKDFSIYVQGIADNRSSGSTVYYLLSLADSSGFGIRLERGNYSNAYFKLYSNNSGTGSYSSQINFITGKRYGLYIMYDSDKDKYPKRLFYLFIPDLDNPSASDISTGYVWIQIGTSDAKMYIGGAKDGSHRYYGNIEKVIIFNKVEKELYDYCVAKSV